MNTKYNPDRISLKTRLIIGLGVVVLAVAGFSASAWINFHDLP
jgi:hypothetical protein